ncbi:uncharacterized protein LOC134848584 [Symsagittifera roscoffensis]|uniref:uncharacterized protein LOC134848584 n=1 Tax=Symsagittifera roscoffensis TaxID=84072 RepID=UPI00307CB365
MLSIFPRNSLHIPTLVYFAGAVSFQMTLMCILAIMVVKLHFTDENAKANKYLRAVSASKVVYFIGLEPFPSQKKNSISPTASKTEKQVEENKNGPAEEMNPEEEMKNRSANNGDFWRHLAMVLDRIFLGFHVAIMTAIATYFLFDFY